MKTFLVVLAAGFSVFFSASVLAADVLCKSVYLPTENTFLYTNQDLANVKGEEYADDCEKVFTPILANEALPTVDGVRSAVRFSYTMPKDDLFPFIDRMLAVYPRKTTKIEIHFWLDDVSSAGDADLTDIRIELMPK